MTEMSAAMAAISSVCAGNVAGYERVNKITKFHILKIRLCFLQDIGIVCVG